MILYVKAAIRLHWLAHMCYFWPQMSGFRSFIVLCIITILAIGCANISTLPGGKKDTKAPKLVSVSPKDSMLDTRVKKLELHFDEFVNVVDASKEVEISPILSIPISVTGAYKKVTVKIEDSLLQANTTYRISFGNAIKDVHEGNPFKGYTYTFSTGSYFDSLEISGEVINAVTGMPDTSATVLLYSASKTDSAVLQEKPMYVGKVNNGHFSIKGLPGRKLKIYALRDANNNLVYDGNNEWIAFTEKTIQPGDTAAPKILLRLFPEIPDTSRFKTDSLKEIRRAATAKPKADSKADFTYTLNVDTTNKAKRTKDITKPIEIKFSSTIDSVTNGKLSMYLDTTDVLVETTIKRDSLRKDVLLVNAAWKENTVYTLKIHKGFAKDTSGNEVMPSKYVFRTQGDEDYGKLNVHLPGKYLGPGYVLLIKNDKDTIWQKPVADTMVRLVLLQPGNYSMLIITDANGNGKWDTGDLMGRRQPEVVIPYKNGVLLKAGWENTVDFEEVKKPKMGDNKEKDSPQKRK